MVDQTCKQAVRFFRTRPRKLIDQIRGLPGSTHGEIKSVLNAVYTPCCNTAVVTAELSDDIKKMIDELIDSIFKGKDMNDASGDLRAYFIDQLTNAVVKGFGSSLDDIAYDSPDYRMLAALTRDVVHFSAAKDATMRRAIASELIDSDGKLRSYSDFKRAAYSITTDHVNTWLQAEYNLAVASAQMAAKWTRIVEDSGILPYITLDVVLDGGTTEICRPLDGVTLRYDNPLLDIIYPPNHFGCRTTVRQDFAGELTPDNLVVIPEKMPDMFKVNLAKSGLAFPPDHPYYGQ